MSSWFAQCSPWGVNTGWIGTAPLSPSTRCRRHLAPKGLSIAPCCEQNGIPQPGALQIAPFRTGRLHPSSALQKGVIRSTEEGVVVPLAILYSCAVFVTGAPGAPSPTPKIPAAVLVVTLAVCCAAAAPEGAPDPEAPEYPGGIQELSYTWAMFLDWKEVAAAKRSS